MQRTICAFMFLFLSEWTAATFAAEPEEKPATEEEAVTVADSITVTAASRRRERIAEAPAAVSVATQSEIELQASHGQVPKLLENAPGVELTQSGIYDFNLNLRGFNSALNRRVLVLVDGRDASMPFTGSQEWPAVSFPLYDLESAELVRGPAAALYGADAFNGVLNLVTRTPRDSQGGTAQLTLGELSNQRLDARYSRALGGGWYTKVVGGTQQSDDFNQPRTEGGEYPGLPLEGIAPPRDKVDVDFGGLRFDKDLAGGKGLLTVEGGTAWTGGAVAVTYIGRIQVMDSRRPWARFNLNMPRWNLMASQTERDSDKMVSLVTAGHLYLEEKRTSAELQGNTELWQGRARLVGGASYSEISSDSADPNGVQTLILGAVREERQGIFAQLDSDLGDRLKAVAALRWDKSSLREGRFSPKGALVWSVRPGQTLRLSYNEAYQNPNFGELFTSIPVAAPVDLSAIEQALAPVLNGVPLGFGSIPVLALGNENLREEEVRSFEAGYSATLGRSLYLTVDVYRNEAESFVSTLLPQLGTSLGRLNPDYGPYRPPAALSPQASALVLATLAAVLPPELFALLSNRPDGSPVFAALSVANVGRVDTLGVELGLQAALSRDWSLSLAYSHLDFDIEEEVSENPILPNTAQDRAQLSVSWTGERLGSSLGLRWVDGFPWRTGIFQGFVPSYHVVDWYADYKINDRWRLGLNVANLLDEEHYEMFGGDLLGRRALGSVTFSW